MLMRRASVYIKSMKKLRFKRSLCVVVTTLVTIFVAFMALLRNHFNMPILPDVRCITYSSARYCFGLPKQPNAQSQSQSNPVSYPTHVLVQPSRSGRRSSGEVIRVHRPFSLSSHPKRHPYADLRCTDFSGKRTITTRRRALDSRACKAFLKKQVWEGTYAGFANVSRYSSTDAHSQCANSTAIIVPLSWRDSNVCHLLMKFLFAFTAHQRVAYTPAFLGHLPSVSTVIVLAPNPEDKALVDLESSFLGGLLRALFIDHGIDVVIAPSIPSLARRRACFTAAVFVGSHANRFAFPDALLGPYAGYDTRFSSSSQPFPSRPAPLSSDALALRSHIFSVNPKGSSGVPRMKNKLLYVTRRGAGRRRWNDAGEVAFVEMLRDVTLAHGMDLITFEGKTGMSFWEQVEYFQDAAVIVGFHGAGLALCAFSPPGSVLIEIEPDYHLLSLFGNLQSAGLIYERITLSTGTMDEPDRTSALIEADNLRIRETIARRFRQRRER